jgi:hypothetical protein
VAASCPIRDAAIVASNSHTPISPLEGEMSGRTEGGNPNFGVIETYSPRGNRDQDYQP